MSNPTTAGVTLRPSLTVVVLSCLLVACNSDSGAMRGTLEPSTQQANAAAEFSPLDIAAAIDPAVAFNLQVDLTGNQMLPPIAVAQTARAEITLDTTTNELYGVVDPVVSSVTQVHIHEGAAGEVGSVVVELIPAADGSDQYVVPPGTVLSDERADQLVAGNLYIDLHTEAYPDGLLRAQLTEDAVQVSVQSALDSIQATIFTPFCSGCHTGSGQTLPTVMNLTSADASFTSLVGVNSIEVPELSRVDPFDADASYLVHKIEGSQSVGVRMPFRGAKLSDEQINAVRQWISQGAVR